MSPMLPASAAVLQVLQAGFARHSAREDDSADMLLAAANGKPVGARQAAPDPSDIYSVNSTDVNKLRVDLTERLGKEFGLSPDDFESVSSFGREIKRIVDRLTTSAEGMMRIAEIERELGLDELGISLITFVQALADPAGSAAEEVDNALRAAVGDLNGGEGRHGAVIFDDVGIYRP